MVDFTVLEAELGKEEASELVGRADEKEIIELNRSVEVDPEDIDEKPEDVEEDVTELALVVAGVDLVDGGLEGLAVGVDPGKTLEGSGIDDSPELSLAEELVTEDGGEGEALKVDDVDAFEVNLVEV